MVYCDICTVNASNSNGLSIKLHVVRVCLWLLFCVFRGETEGVSCWRERGVEDPHPSQRNKTTVWNCERRLFQYAYTFICNARNQNLTIVNSVIETGVHWFWWEKEDKQKEADDSGGKSELFYSKYTHYIIGKYYRLTKKEKVAFMSRFDDII